MRTTQKVTACLIMLFMVSLRAAAVPAATGAAEVKLLSVQKIWDEAPHNAFTDLVRFKDRWICAFREAPAHKGGVRDSSIRVIVSEDTKQWQAIARLADPRGDIRDAKMVILPDGRLMLLTATQLFDQSSGQTHQSIAFFSDDAKTWEGPVDVGEPNIWLWGIEWHKDAGYSIGYGTAGTRLAQLYRTTDGRKFERIGDKFDLKPPHPNESAICFDADDTARVLLRFDPDPAQVGSAKPPYTKWEWKESNLRVGGPALTRTPGGMLLGGGRLYEPEPRMALFWVDEKTGKLTECLALPSGGDTSYPGFAWDDQVLCVSYYASHEGKSSIYFARVSIDGTDAHGRK